MAEDVLQRLRALCLSFPEATEKEAWGTPTFRIRDKLFAMWDDHHHGVAHVAVWCKAPAGVQEILTHAAPRRFFVPPYVGPKGWIGVRLDGEVDWDEVHDFLEESFLMTAPKRMVAAYRGETAAPAARRPARKRS